MFYISFTGMSIPVSEEEGANHAMVGPIDFFVKFWPKIVNF